MGCYSSGNLSILDVPVLILIQTHLSAMTDGNSCLLSDNSGNKFLKKFHEKSLGQDFLLAEQYYFETFISGLLIEGGSLIKVSKKLKSVSLVAGNTVDSLFTDTSI